MSNPYESPADDDDIGSLKTPIIVPIASFAAVVSSVFTAASGFQLWSMLYIFSLMKVVPPILMLLGLVGMGVGGMLVRARAWAAVGSLVIAVISGMLCLIWTVWGLFAGGFALLPLVAAMACGLTVLLVPFTIVPSLRLGEARRKLYA